jgi:hypothetical protein
MPTPPDRRFFERWFVLLAKHKLGAALLPVSGISIGFFLMISVHVMPEQFASYVGFIGILMLSFSSFCFILVMALYIFFWAKEPFSTSIAESTRRPNTVSDLHSREAVRRVPSRTAQPS